MGYLVCVPFLTVVANDVVHICGITLGGKIFTYKVANPIFIAQFILK